MHRRICTRHVGLLGHLHSARTASSNLRPRGSQWTVAVRLLHSDRIQDKTAAKPFAVEHVGARECQILWPADGRSGVERKWQNPAEAQPAEGKVAAPKKFGTGRVSSWLAQMFLPTNFPQSVHRSYLAFHSLQFLETIFSTVVSVLCNQALLTSVGVSAEGSIFGAVAVQWIIKDGAGEFAKLAFIRQYAPYFDSHPKTFNMMGETLQAIGSGLQIASVLLTPTPGNFLLCAAGGNVFKMVGGAIWFTTHIKFIRYFASQGNTGDVAAKDESQSSIAQLLGYAAGISLLTVSHSAPYLYLVYFLTVPLHLTTTTLMMRVTKFELLTVPRISWLASHYVEKGEVVSLDTLEAEKRTGVFGEYYKHKDEKYLQLTPSVANVVGHDAQTDKSRWEVCADVFKNERYLLFPSTTPANPTISIFLHPAATKDDTLRAVLHASRLRDALLKRDAVPPPPPEVVEDEDGAAVSDATLRSTLFVTHIWAQEHFQPFKRGLEHQAWRTEEICFADHGRRVEWAQEDAAPAPSPEKGA